MANAEKLAQEFNLLMSYLQSRENEINHADGGFIMASVVLGMAESYAISLPENFLEAMHVIAVGLAPCARPRSAKQSGGARA